MAGRRHDPTSQLLIQSRPSEPAATSPSTTTALEGQAFPPPPAPTPTRPSWPPQADHAMTIFKRALLLAAAAAAAFTIAAASDATDVAVAGPATTVEAAAPVDALADVAARSGGHHVKCVKKPIYRIKVIKIRKPVIVRKRICKRFKVPCRHRPSNKMLDTEERVAEPESAVADVADAAPAAEAEEAAEDLSLDAAADREGLDAEDAADEAADEEEEEEEGATAEAEEASGALDTASRGSWRPRHCFKRKCIVKHIKIIKIIFRKKRVLVGYRKVCKRVPRH